MTIKRIQLGDVELSVLDQGSGMPVLLVHGFPLGHTMWAAQIEALSVEYRVIAPDLRGFGASDVTEGSVTMDRLADDLAALLEALSIDEPVVFCGLSMGGYVAWSFWRRHAARLRALVLCDTRAMADTPEAAHARLETAERVVEEGPEFLVEAMVPKLLAAGTIQDSPQVVERLQRVMLATDPQGIAAASRGMAERADATSILSEIACPTLVVVGREDAISTVEEMQGIAGQIPNARMVEITAAGHMSPMENPAAVNEALLGFLRGLAD